MRKISSPRTDWSVISAIAVGRSALGLGFLLTAVFFVLSFIGLAVLGPNESSGYRNCIFEEPGRTLAQEGQSFRYEGNLWPPGIRCIYGRPDGHEVSMVRPVTVGQVAFLALLCGAAGGGTAYVALRFRRRQKGS